MHQLAIEETFGLEPDWPEIDLEDIHAVHVTDEALASIEAELAERGHLDVWPDELSEILDLRVPWARSQYFQD